MFKQLSVTLGFEKEGGRPSLWRYSSRVLIDAARFGLAVEGGVLASQLGACRSMNRDRDFFVPPDLVTSQPLDEAGAAGDCVVGRQSTGVARREKSFAELCSLLWPTSAKLTLRNHWSPARRKRRRENGLWAVRGR